GPGQIRRASAARACPRAHHRVAVDPSGTPGIAVRNSAHRYVPRRWAVCSITTTSEWRGYGKHGHQADVNQRLVDQTNVDTRSADSSPVPFGLRCDLHASGQGSGAGAPLLRAEPQADAGRSATGWQVHLSLGSDRAGTVSEAGRHQGRAHGAQLSRRRHRCGHCRARGARCGLRGLRHARPEDRGTRLRPRLREGGVVPRPGGQLPVPPRRSDLNEFYLTQRSDEQEGSMSDMQAHADGTKAEWKNFGRPDEIREFPRGRLELLTIGGATVGRAVFEPGWRWSDSVQPLVNTRSCEAPHFQYHVAGVLHILMDDGTEFDCKPGDVSLLPSGHDAWVIGDVPAIVVDFQGMIDYAKSH